MKKTTILIGNGHIPSFYKEILKEAFIVAVDGGANFLYTKKIIPDEIIGDLDSLNNNSQKYFTSQGVKITKISAQDTTDLEKAIKSIDSEIYICLGFWSEEVGHSLNNFHILQKFSHKKIIFLTQKSGYFLLPQKGRLDIPQNTTISIYPLVKTEFLSSRGLKYPLKNISLEQGKFIGIRNKTNKNFFEWEIKNGKSIGIIPSKYKKTVIDNVLNFS